MKIKDILRIAACIAAIVAAFTAGVAPSTHTAICFVIMLVYLAIDYKRLMA